jgi:protein-S-isoprenylcysteine O-methyltransferase Ste14
MFMKTITLTLAVCCLLSFAWGRRHFFVQSQGVSRHRGGLAPLGSVFGVLVVVFVAASSVELGTYFARLGAVLMFSISLALFWWAARAYGDLRPSIAFSPGAPCDLVTSGPYKFMRHPFYSAYMMFWLAFAVHSWNILALVPALSMGVIYYKAAKGEEEAIMSSALRDAYIDYSKSAGMFLPRLV